jgi:LysM repeat protein
MDDEIEIERREKYPSSPERGSGPFLADKKKPILIGIGVLAAAVIVYVLGFSGKDKSAEMIAQLEQKLAAIEQRTAALEKQIEDVASGPLKSLGERVEMLEKRPVEPPKPPAAPKVKTAAPAPAKRYHEVKKGETVTAIAKRYGLAPEELRRLNNLSPKASLSVGQKLVVGSGGKR